MGVFDQFGISVYRTVRGRGAFICETSDGMKLLRETVYSREKYAKEDFVTRALFDSGYETVDVFCKTLAGELFAEDEDKKKYYLKNWFEAAECDVKSYHDVISAVAGIARMHLHLNLIRVNREELPFKIPVAESTKARFGRKYKEMRSINNYLRKKKKKTDFERKAWENMQGYLLEAESAMELLEQFDYDRLFQNAEEKVTLAHGSCNHHNILTGRDYVAVVNFERAHINLQITDLYDFMRKILEKYHWDIKLAYRMIDEYNRVKTISEEELKLLAVLFGYPEKYFKIMNHYYTSSKAWIPDKDIEKLNVVINQNEARLRFVESLK